MAVPVRPSAGIALHKLYALDVMLDGLKRGTKAQVEAAMQGHGWRTRNSLGRRQDDRATSAPA
jgi:hypothetical protein